MEFYENSQEPEVAVLVGIDMGLYNAQVSMDELEELGVVGAFEGAKPRQVLMTREMFLQRKLGSNSADPSEGVPEELPFEE